MKAEINKPQYMLSIKQLPIRYEVLIVTEVLLSQTEDYKQSLFRVGLVT